MKMSVIIIISILAVLTLVLVLFTHRIPPRTLTTTLMNDLERRIREYAEVHDMPPESLSALPHEEGRLNRFTDGWGRPVQYAVDNENITLLSLGEDGQRGGSGDAADIRITFEVKAEVPQADARK